MRKKSSLSTISRAAKTLRIKRKNESQSQREKRLSSQRERQALKRSSEKNLEREYRLATNRARHTISRASESAQKLEARLNAQRDRQRLLRAAEDREQRNNRLASDRERHAISRALKSTQQYRPERLKIAKDTELHIKLSGSCRARQAFTKTKQISENTIITPGKQATIKKKEKKRKIKND